ncbi:hypothetical protein [Streptomyces sp. NPDC091215]|uniref:hypothetical protein n=1 Tax=Streptomyces sp. NPDC091215 TaxID=3155192 RepID=UPI0034196524
MSHPIDEVDDIASTEIAATHGDPADGTDSHDGWVLSVAAPGFLPTIAIFAIEARWGHTLNDWLSR